MAHFHRMLQTCNWAHTLLMFNGGHPIHSHNWQGGNSHWRDDKVTMTRLRRISSSGPAPGTDAGPAGTRVSLWVWKWIVATVQHARVHSSRAPPLDRDKRRRSRRSSPARVFLPFLADRMRLHVHGAHLLCPWLTKTNRHGLDLGFATTHHPSYHPANRHLPHQVPRDVHG